jgi:2-polyprenyl-6-methoxyphenol hydroxylase-like FAD-dependent oxidoreductase
VPNYQLRQALYHRVQQAENITVMTDALVEDVASHESHSDVLFADGKTTLASFSKDTSFCSTKSQTPNFFKIPKDKCVSAISLPSDLGKKLGVWDLVEQKEVSLLKEAKVFDGDSPSLLNFRSATSGAISLPSDLGLEIASIFAFSTTNT